MRRYRGFVAVAAALMVTLGAAVAAAQPSAEEKDAARAAYGLGQKLFTEEHFEKAKVAFEEAFAAVPNPIVLKSIAECEMRLGEVGAAIESFERYLMEKPETRDRAEIDNKLEELRNMPAVLVLYSDPPGAAVTLDGKPGAGTTPVEISVPAGEHTVELTADGYDAATKTIMAGPGERAEVRLTLTALPPPTPAAEPDVSISAADFGTGEGGSSSTAIWVTGTIGVLGLVAGGVLGMMSLSKQSDFDKQPSVETADDGERLALFADVGFGVGAIALITCAVLYMTDGDVESEEEAALRISPTVSATEAGISAQFSF